MDRMRKASEDYTAGNLGPGQLFQVYNYPAYVDGLPAAKAVHWRRDMKESDLEVSMDCMDLDGARVRDYTAGNLSPAWGQWLKSLDGK